MKDIIPTEANSEVEIKPEIKLNNSCSNKTSGVKLVRTLGNYPYNTINNTNYAIRNISSQNNNDKNIHTSLTYRIGSDFCLEQVRDDRPVKIQILESLYRFTLASSAGVCGAFCVYPIDFIKTRMQNVRGSRTDQNVRYTGYMDCLVKTIKNEGFFGLYRGLTPLLISTAPEKAIKLSVQGFVRDRVILMDIFEKRIWAECVGGAWAGLCQVIATNPCEIVKIRLQMSGESGQNVRVASVIRDLGFRGIYKGSRACVCRDILFSSIYFPAYYTLKKKFADVDGITQPLGLFLAGTFAGVPAAGLVTPFDVVKTRIQVIPRPGEQTYHGVINTFSTIYKQEGAKALWRGALARVCRTSPQFGITLVGFEMLQRLINIDFQNVAEQKK